MVQQMSKEVKKKPSKKKTTAPAPVIVKPQKNKAAGPRVEGPEKENKTEEKAIDKPVSAGKAPVKIKDFRWIKITGICLALVVGFALLSALIFNSTNGSKLTDYKTSKEFKSFSASLDQYLKANNSVYTRTFSCSASLEELWNSGLKSPISGKNEPLEVQLARQLIDLKPKWEAASKSFPGYSSFFIFKVLPFDHGVYKDFQNTADLIDRSGALVNHTEDFAYYCPGHLYPGVSIFDFLNEYSKNQPVTENVATINLRMKALVDAGNDYSKTKTPSGWKEVNSSYIAFMKKTLADLTSLRDQTAKTPGKINMHVQFEADKKDLEKVLALAKTAGQKIGPNQSDITKLYDKVIKK